MDWFRYDIGLRHERVNLRVPPIRLKIQIKNFLENYECFNFHFAFIGSYCVIDQYFTFAFPMHESAKRELYLKLAFYLNRAILNFTLCLSI